MNRLILSSTVVGVLTLASGMGFAKTIKGKLLDYTCYKAKGKASMTAQHNRTCGRACMMKGRPAAIWYNGKAWKLQTNSKALANYLGDEAKVTGHIHHHVFVVRKIKVRVHGHWKKVSARMHSNANG